MPTRTPQPTTVPRALATPGPTPPAYALVGVTGRQGANVYREPGLADVLDAVSDGTIVQLTGNTADSSEFVWREVILPDGRVGWLAAQYLVPYDTNQAP